MNATAIPSPQVSSFPFRKRLAALGLVGVVILGLVAIWSHYRYARPVGSGPAGPVVSREPFQSTWSTRKVVLLGLGDSVTQGFGATTGSHSYFQRLAKNPPDEFADMDGICLSRVLPNLEAVNLSISGTTSLECIDYQLPKLKPYDQDTFGIVVMTTGGNDVVHSYGQMPPSEGAMYGARFDQIADWVKNFDTRLETIADKVRVTFPGGCHLFVANIYDPTDGDGDIVYAGLPAWPDGLKVLQAYNDVLSRFAARHPDVTLIDMRGEFLGHGIHCTQFWHPTYRADDPHSWYWDNLEDPNDRGYDALRRLFLKEMACVLPGSL